MFMLGFAIFIFAGTCVCDQPPYQVSLFIRLHLQGHSIPLCNGAIVQSRLIVTTAACVHYQFVPDSPLVPIHPSMISVVAGSSNAFRDTLVFNVSNIEIFNKFNLETMENDLAILRLSTSLPLSLRLDMQWIILDDDEFNDNPCLASFYVRNSLDSVPDFTQTEELPILQTEECMRESNYPNAREKDICSFYTLPLGFECEAVNKFISFNWDRGTALVCNSRLVAIMSSVFPAANNETDCSELSVKAFYTNLGYHLDWIYSIIAIEELLDIMQPDYTASIPYQQELGAIIMESSSNYPPTPNQHMVTEETTIIQHDTNFRNANSSNQYLLLHILYILECFILIILT